MNDKFKTGSLLYEAYSARQRDNLTNTCTIYTNPFGCFFEYNEQITNEVPGNAILNELAYNWPRNNYPTPSVLHEVRRASSGG